MALKTFFSNCDEDVLPQYSICFYELNFWIYVEVGFFFQCYVNVHNLATTAWMGIFRALLLDHPADEIDLFFLSLVTELECGVRRLTC